MDFKSFTLSRDCLFENWVSCVYLTPDFEGYYLTRPTKKNLGVAMRLLSVVGPSKATFVSGMRSQAGS